MHTQDHEAIAARDVVYPRVSDSALAPQSWNSLLVMIVLEFITGVEDTEIVDVLDIALTEIKAYMESICKEVKSVECFGLSFGNWWDVRRPREGLVTREYPSGVLDDDSLFSLVGSRQVMQQGPFVVWMLGVAETVHGVSATIRLQLAVCKEG